MPFSSRPFGFTKAGERVKLYTLKGPSGVEVDVLDFGATLQSIRVPHGARAIDVVQGYDSMGDANTVGYNNKGATSYSGHTVGRCCNRIHRGRFHLPGRTEPVQLVQNNAQNHLHGGISGFDEKVWTVGNTAAFEASTGDDAAWQPALVLTLKSPDGEEGYPGDVVLSAVFSFAKNPQSKSFRCNIYAHHLESSPAQATPINITNHAYFNLDGHEAGAAASCDQTIQLPNCTHIAAPPKSVAINDPDFLVPTEVVPVPPGSLFDLHNKPQRLSPNLDAQKIDPVSKERKNFDWFATGGGYDHAFVRGDTKGDLSKWLSEKYCDEYAFATQSLQAVAPVPIGILTAATSGLQMTVQTTAPSVHFYTGNWHAADLKGKNGASYPQHSGVALEVQGVPNSVNREGIFPSVLLQRGQHFRRVMQYDFALAS